MAIVTYLTQGDTGGGEGVEITPKPRDILNGQPLNWSKLVYRVILGR